MLQTQCASREELSDLSLGKLPPQRLDQVAEHLEACSTCQVAFASLETVGDTLFTALQPGADNTSLDAESALQQGLERIRELGATLGSQVVADEDLGTIRDYRLLARLGQGGMGTVYKALHMQLEKIVALKVLPADRMHPEAIARFKREMKAVGKLHHAHIVQAFDAGEHDGRHFLVMELVDGADLAAIVRQQGPLKIADACEVARQTALALEYVRQHGMVHRDIKPSNMVINTAGQVKVLDLGLARLHDPGNEGEELTSASQAMGTADYLAPEQIGDSHGVDIRADLYALGCTLYKLLTSAAPYAEKRTAAQKMVAHLSQPFPDVRAARPEVPAGLKAVLDRLVAKEPGQRHATPAEVATALEPFCSGHDLAVLARVTEHEAFDPPAPTLASATGDPSLDETSTLVAGGVAKPQAKEGIVAHGPSLAGSGDWFSVRKLVLALAAGGLAMLLGTVVLIQTRDGTLVLSVEGPHDGTQPVIKVDGKDQNVTVDKDGKTYRIRVKPGAHELLVTTPDGIEFGVQDKFSMSWGGETKLTAQLEKREMPPAGPGDADRRAAEYVLSIGGGVKLNDLGLERSPTKVDELPREPFQLIGVELNHNPKVTEKGLAVFDNCQNVVELSLMGSGVKDSWFSHFKNCKKLRSLDLQWAGDVTDAGLVHFKDCRDLRLLKIQSDRVTDEGLAHFRECRKLTTLWLIGPRVTNGGVLATFSGLKDLTDLVLHVGVGDAGLAAFKECKQLSSLNLCSNVMTNDGLRHFQGCKDLVEFSGNFTPIDGGGLSHLKASTKLASVRLARGALNDEHLLNLANFPLTYVDIHGTAVTEPAVKKLAAALPRCKIDWDGGVIEPKIIADADRRAAEYVLSIGGAIGIQENGQLREISTADDLPETPFELSIVRLDHNTKLNAAGLESFQDCRNITELSLEGTPLGKGEGLVNFKDCKQLTRLNLSGRRLTDAALTHFKNCQNLTQLSLHDTWVSDEGLANFAMCKNLVSLALGNTHATDKGFAHFKDCTKLADLHIGHTKLTDDGLSYFEHCQGLKALRLEGTLITDTGLASLADRSQLVYLNVAGAKVTEAGVKKLAAALPKCSITWEGGIIEPFGARDRAAALWALSIGGVVDRYGGLQIRNPENVPQEPFEIMSISLRERPVKDDDLQRLQGLTKISYLDLHACGIGNVGLTHLESLSSLTALELSGTNVSAAALESLRKLPKLNSLAIGGTKFRPSHYRRLKELPALVYLHLGSDPDFGNEEAKVLPELPAVEYLSLNYSNIGDEGLREVARLPSLRHMHLQGCPGVTGAGLPHLAALPNLQVLDVGLTKVTDEGLEALADYPALEQFLAPRTAISDRGLEHLARAKGLKYVSLSATAVTAEGIAKLGKALPQCKIEWDGGTIEPREK